MDVLPTTVDGATEVRPLLDLHSDEKLNSPVVNHLDSHISDVDNMTDCSSILSNCYDSTCHEVLLDSSCLLNSDVVDNCSDVFFLKKGLQIFHLNIHYLYPKIDDIKLLLHQHCNIDIMCFCETFLDSHILDSVLHIDGFNFYRRDRESHGGGILIYFDTNLSINRRHDLESSAIESIWFELKYPNSKPILFCYIYRPPSSKADWLTDFTNCLEQFETENKECIVFGDFNFDLLKDSGYPKAWADHMLSFNFTQLVTKPTRVSANSKTLIDHVFTNRPQNITETNIPSYSVSDHYPICFTRKHMPSYSKGPVHKCITYRSLKYFNDEDFRQDLLQQQWSALDFCSCSDNGFEYFITLFKAVLDRHAPLKTKRVKRNSQPEWINTNNYTKSYKNQRFLQKTW
jgi:exonuclease III